jgi:hypothetical protein
MCGDKTKFSGCLRSSVSLFPVFSTRPCLVGSAGWASRVYAFLGSVQIQCGRRLK